MSEQPVTVEFFYGGAWHPAVAYERDPVTIGRGATREGGTAPATGTFTLDNRAGTWSTHIITSPAYGLVGQSTPVRIVCGDSRLWGEVASMTPARTPDFDPVAGRGDAWVSVEVAGTMRRGIAGREPLMSPLRRAILDLAPTAYWPLEDASDADSGSSALDGVGAMRPYAYSRFQVPGTGEPQPLAGLPRFATGDGIPGSLPVPDFAQGGVLVGRVPVPESGTQGWRVACVAVFPRDMGHRATVWFGWTVSTGQYTQWEIQAAPDGMSVRASDPKTLLAGYGVSTAPVALFDGRPHFLEITARTASGLLDVRVYVDGWQFGTLSTINAATLAHAPGWVETVTVNSLEWRQGQTQVEGMPQVGHVAVWQPTAPMGGHVEAMHGHIGETTLQRFERLCREHGFTGYYAGADPDDVQRMGVQPVATLIDQLGEVARTEAGLIYETRGGPGLVLALGRGMYGQAPAVTLDYAAGHLAGLTYTLDAKDLQNDVTAASPTGARARRTLDVGPMSTAAPPNGVGQYETRLDVNPYDVGRLASYAQRAVYAGTLPGPHITAVVVDVGTNGSLAGPVGNLDPGDRVRLVNLAADITPDPVDLVVLGSVEVIGTHTRTITLHTGPAAAVDAARVGVDRADSEASTLAGAVTATATALTVTRAAGSARWATAADGATFPFDVGLAHPAAPAGRERVTVTAIAGTGATQTFTVLRARSGVGRAWPVGTRVRLWARPVVGL